MFVCGVIALASFFPAVPTNRADHRPNLRVEPSELEVGEVLATADLDWTLTIINEAESSVRVRDFRASCNCTKFTPKNFELSPGGSQKVNLRINLAAYHTPQQDLDISVSPVLANGDVLAPWRLRGKVTPACRLSTSHIHYSGAEALIQGKLAPATHIQARLYGKASRITAVSSNPDDVIEIVKPAADENEFDLSIVPSTKRPLGWFRDTVTLHARDLDGVILANRKLELQGEVRSRLHAFPQSLSLGAYRVGTIAHDSASVDHPDAEILDMLTKSDDTTVRREPISPTQTTLHISQKIGAHGPTEERVQIVYQLRDGVIGTHPIEITYVGVSPLDSQGVSNR